MELSKRHFMAILLILFSLYTLYDITAPFNDNNFVLEAEESPEIVSNYNPKQEHLDIRIKSGSFTRRSVKVALDNSNHTNLTLQGHGKKKDTNIWASRSIYGLGIGNSGITDFPIKEGENISVVSDSTDTDGDGTEGIENGETVIIYSKDDGVDAPVKIIKIKQNRSLDAFDLRS